MTLYDALWLLDAAMLMAGTYGLLLQYPEPEPETEEEHLDRIWHSAW